MKRPNHKTGRKPKYCSPQHTQKHWRILQETTLVQSALDCMVKDYDPQVIDMIVTLNNKTIISIAWELGYIIKDGKFSRFGSRK